MFDINRHARKFSKHRLCIYCRTHLKKVTDLKCMDCGKSFPHNGQKIYCGECQHTGRLIRERMRQYDRKKKKTKECIMCFGLISMDSKNQKICSEECMRCYHYIWEENRRLNKIKPQTIN